MSNIEIQNNNFLKGIKVAGFDFDGLLVDEEYSIKKRWQKVLNKYSYLSPDIGKTFFRIYENKGPSYKFHLNDALAELKIDRGIAKEIISNFLSARSDELLFEHSLEILRLLKKNKIIIGIITDGRKSYQEERIKNAGVYNFMDFIYYGNGNKEIKPTAEMLDSLYKLFDRFSIKSFNQFLYVGHDFESDVSGMLLAGAKVCWITEEKNMPESNKIIKIKDLKELLNMLINNFK